MMDTDAYAKQTEMSIIESQRSYAIQTGRAESNPAADLTGGVGFRSLALRSPIPPVAEGRTNNSLRDNHLGKSRLSEPELIHNIQNSSLPIKPLNTSGYLS